jgi:DNA-binding transcriptional ArsR family regulator
LTPRGRFTILKQVLNTSTALNGAFRALSDPTRRAILERLSRGPASVSEIAEPLPMSLPAVHQHLQVLEECGLMEWEKKGRVRWCRLDRKGLAAAEAWVLNRRALWERRLDALGAHLAKDEEKRGGKA